MSFSDLTPIISLFGFAITIYVLSENHVWNRRQYAATLITQWNDKTLVHRKGIERLRPGLVDLIAGKPQEITKQDAKNIYEAKPDTKEWELRFHFIELLNFLESISSAYLYHVGDREMIEKSFKAVLIKHHKILINYINHVDAERGYNTWEPFTNLIGQWSKIEPIASKPTGNFLRFFGRRN